MGPSGLAPQLPAGVGFRAALRCVRSGIVYSRRMVRIAARARSVARSPRLKGAAASLTTASVVTVAVAACGPSPLAPSSAPPRESGQSHLIEKTFAGKNRCNPQDHTRPFAVEWDATDISSFESRATTDVIFVRYEGCHLQVVDSCTNDAVRGSLGAYGAVDWTSGAVEKVDILNEDELYAKLPLGANVIGARVQGGERFHMEYFVSGTRKATRPAVYRAELDKLPGCRGVTHFVYSYNVGAFALGSFSKLEGSAGASFWGASAGGSRKNESAIEKQGGVLASCRGESASEVATCKVPIRLSLREIETGENPDATAAVAPETPDALNLAGKLAASNERSREANERLSSAQRKLTAGDGKGCLAELDAYDRLDGRPGTLSTDPKGMGQIRSTCLMLSGQCDAGRALARRATQARQPNESPARIDSSVDQQVAVHCGDGAKTPRDKLLVALRTLNEGAQRDRTTAKACSAALDSAVAALPKVSVRDEEDRTVKGAARSIAEDGAKCLARAGDCVNAWKRYAPLLTARGKAENLELGTTPKKLRSSFETATYGECVGKEQGPLTPVEDLVRSVEELDWAASHSTTVVTTALCNDLIGRGTRALQSLAEDKSDLVKFSRNYLRTEGAKCLTKAGDCAASRAQFVSSYMAEHPSETLLRGEDAFASAQFGGKCNASLVPGLSPKESVAHALRVLVYARRENKPCGEPFEALKKGVAAARDTDMQTKLESDLWRRPLACFDEALQCTEAWNALKTTNAWRRRPLDDRHLRETFSSFTSKCADATVPGLSSAEQYWAAIRQLSAGEKKTKDKCIALHQVAKRTAAAASPPANDDTANADIALARCIGRSGDCAGVEQALAPTRYKSNASFVKSLCKKD